MKLKSLLFFILFATIINQVSAQEKRETLTDLIDEAISKSPKIKLLESKLNVAAARIEQGTNLPDPVLTIGLMNMPVNSFSFTQEPMTGKTIGLTQKIPYPSGLSAAEEVKAIDTVIVWQEIKDQKNTIKKEISNLYYDLRLAKAETVLNEERITLLQKILEVVKAKSEVAKSSMQNIIKVEVELTMIRDNLVKLKSKEKAIVAEMNAILLRNENRPINIDPIKISEYQLFAVDDILSFAKENQPKLKEILLSEKKSKLMVNQAEYGFYPNFSIGLQYSQREYNKLTGVDYNDLVSVVAGISLPINYGGKKTAKINEAKYLQNLYREKYNSAVQDLNGSISVIVMKIEELTNRHKLIFNSLLPLAEQSLHVALSDYQVDKIDFVNVINAEKEILNVKTELYRIQTEYDQNVVMLEFLAGSKYQAELRSMEN